MSPKCSISDGNNRLVGSMCSHYYVIDRQVVEGWSLARCKWCMCRDAFRSYFDVDSHGQTIRPTLAEKRAFLRSQGVTVTQKQWSKEERLQVVLSVSRIGVNATARKFNMPPSTVCLWAKGKSPNFFKGTQYPLSFKKEVASYAHSIDNNKKTARTFNVSRGAVQAWRKKYCITI